MLGTILGRFSIIYFRGLGLMIRVRVWVSGEHTNAAEESCAAGVHLGA